MPIQPFTKRDYTLGKKGKVFYNDLAGYRGELMLIFAASPLAGRRKLLGHTAIKASEKLPFAYVDNGVLTFPIEEFGYIYPDEKVAFILKGESATISSVKKYTPGETIRDVDTVTIEPGKICYLGTDANGNTALDIPDSVTSYISGQTINKRIISTQNIGMYALNARVTGAIPNDIFYIKIPAPPKGLYAFNMAVILKTSSRDYHFELYGNLLSGATKPTVFMKTEADDIELTQYADYDDGRLVLKIDNTGNKLTDGYDVTDFEIVELLSSGTISGAIAFETTTSSSSPLTDFTKVNSKITKIGKIVLDGKEPDTQNTDASDGADIKYDVTYDDVFGIVDGTSVNLSSRKHRHLTTDHTPDNEEYIAIKYGRYNYSSKNDTKDTMLIPLNYNIDTFTPKAISYTHNVNSYSSPSSLFSGVTTLAIYSEIRGGVSEEFNTLKKIEDYYRAIDCSQAFVNYTDRLKADRDGTTTFLVKDGSSVNSAMTKAKAISKYLPKGDVLEFTIGNDNVDKYLPYYTAGSVTDTNKTRTIDSSNGVVVSERVGSVEIRTGLENGTHAPGYTIAVASDKTIHSMSSSDVNTFLSVKDAKYAYRGDENLLVIDGIVYEAIYKNQKYRQKTIGE